MEQLVRRVGVLVREQHQHDRGRRASLRLQSGTYGTLNRYARDKGLLKEKEENLEGEDVREGLAAVISVKLRNPQFEGQTKTKLGNPPIEGLVKTTVNQQLAAVPRGEPDRRAADHHQGGLGVTRPPGSAQGARADAPQERARVELAPGPPRRLPDLGSRSLRSSSSSRETRPAAPPSTLATGRFQAILPLRGKVINAEKNRINKVLSNEEIQAIITAIGTGIARGVRRREASLPPRSSS